MEVTPFAAAVLLLTQPARLEVQLPPEGLAAGREDAVVIFAVDSAGALSQVNGTPTLSGAGGAPERVADGIWQARVAPPAAGPLTLSATLGALGGRESVVVAPVPRLALSLNDTELAPGERGVVIALVDVRTSSGDPLDGITPIVETSMGAVTGPPKRIGPGKWSASVRMSDKRYPHVALVTASLPRRDVPPAVAVVALRGRASIPIASEPNAKITVRVGKRSYGPLVADRTGAVEAAIEVGPADAAMEVETKDAAGNTSTKTVPLDMPPYPRLWAQAFAAPNGLDGRTRVSVHAVVLDRRGLPGGEAPKAVVGATAIPLTGAHGVFTGSAIVALPAGSHTVTISAGDEKQRKTITAVPPPAVAIAIEVAGGVRVAMGSAPAAVSAWRIDAQGQRVPGPAPALSATGLRLSGAKVAGDTATATILPLEGLLPPVAWVAARAAGPGVTLAARKTIVVLPGEPAKVEILSVAPPSLPADGESTAVMEARITDKWGNPVPAAKLAASSSSGDVMSSAETELGLYRVVLRAPRQPGSGTIALVAGGARTEGAIAFVRPPPKWAVAAGAGGTHNLGSLGSALGWVEARRTLGRGDAPWAVLVRGHAAQGSFQAKTPSHSFDVSIRQALGFAGIRRRFTAPFSGWALGASIAGGAGTIEVTEASAVGTVVDSAPAMGGRAALSGERVMGRGAVAIELGYGYVTTDDALVKGNLAGAELTVGYRHGF